MRELDPSKRDGSKRWELRVYVGRDPDRTVRDEDGKVIKQGPPVHVSKVFRGGKRDAARALDKLVAKTGDRSAVGTGATLGKLLTDWLASLERLGKARSTVETYRIHVEKHIRPALGSVKLDKLTVHDIHRYLGSLADQGLSAATIKLNHAVLRAALAQGVDWGWVKDNPAKRARLGTTVPKKTDKPFTAEHVGLLYQAAMADEDIDMATVIAMAAITGCRRGELAGLRWDDLDAERQCLRVERQWVPGSGGQHLVDKTKSGNGRTVFIGADGVELLERYRSVKRDHIQAEPDGWLLSYDGGTTPLRAKSMTEYVGRLMKRVGAPGTLHTFRHWKQSELNRQGVDLPTAADQGGHSVGVMAGTYLHTDDKRGAAAGALVSAVVVDALSNS